MRKKVIALLIGIACVLGIDSNVSAQDDYYAMLGNPLGDTTAKISDFVNGKYTVNISSQMQNMRYNLAPDNYYMGNLTITNDQLQTVNFNGLETYGKVTKNSDPNYTVNDYLMVLDEWMLYSFAINSRGLNLADNPINRFPGATSTIQGDSVVSQGGFTSLYSVSLAPGESITLYYDFSLPWFVDNRTNDMPMDLQFSVVIDPLTMYGITTEVENGEITESISDALEGTNSTISYAPKEGYELDKVIVDGVEQDIQAYPNSYTFSNIQTNHTIEVVYKKINDTPPVIPEEPEKPTEVDNGETVPTPPTGIENNIAVIYVSFLIAGTILMIQMKKRLSKR